MIKYSRENHKKEYITFHNKRFDYLLRAIDMLGLNNSVKILDIGRSPFTKLLLDKHGNITTLGFSLDTTLLDKADPVDLEKVPHIVFDLNKCDDESSWCICEQSDIIIFAEVLEHLYVNPLNVFRYLSLCLKESGIIICQTPNAASLTKRIKMALGKNPFSIVDPSAELGSHHFREYTKSEIVKILKNTNLEIISHEYKNYFSHSSILKSIYFKCISIIPSFREGQTFILKKISKNT